MFGLRSVLSTTSGSAKRKFVVGGYCLRPGAPLPSRLCNMTIPQCRAHDACDQVFRVKSNQSLFKGVADAMESTVRSLGSPADLSGLACRCGGGAGDARFRGDAAGSTPGRCG